MYFNLSSALVLGTVQLGLPYGRKKLTGLCSVEESEIILETAWKFGVRAFDTAFGYGCAMERLSNWLQATGRMGQAKIVNKVSPGECGSKMALEKACLPFRDVAKLDLMVHGFVMGKDWNTFQKLAKELGASPGLSVYTANEVLQAKALGAELVQAPANVLDYRQLKAAKEVEQKTDFRSIFLQGLLLDSVEIAESRFPGSGVFAKAVEVAAATVGLSPPAALIGAILHAKKPSDRLVIGVDSPKDIGVWQEALAVTANQCSEFISEFAKESKIAPSDQMLDPRTWPV